MGHIASKSDSVARRMSMMGGILSSRPLRPRPADSAKLESRSLSEPQPGDRDEGVCASRRPKPYRGNGNDRMEKKHWSFDDRVGLECARPPASVGPDQHGAELAAVGAGAALGPQLPR